MLLPKSYRQIKSKNSIYVVTLSIINNAPKGQLIEISMAVLALHYWVFLIPVEMLQTMADPQ